MKQLLFSLCLVIHLFCACTANRQDVMNHAETLIENTPDSALLLLEELLPNYEDFSFDEKAHFGLLYFMALDKNDLDLEPVDIIDYSLNYYQENNKNDRLAHTYLYKARHFLYNNQLKEASTLLFDALKKVSKNNFALLGKIYFDLGVVCYHQDAYDKAVSYYEKALENFERACEQDNIAATIIALGEIHYMLGNSHTAHAFFEKALAITTDSIAYGDIYYQISGSFLEAGNVDSALHYIRKSLNYKSIEPNHSLKLFFLSNLFFLEHRFDSAEIYANTALAYPSNIYIKKECYRLLRDIAIANSNENEIAEYLNLYDIAVDSILKIESKPHITISENLHYAELEAAKTHENNQLLLLMLGIILIATSVIYIYMTKSRNKERWHAKQQRQLLLKRNNLIQKIESEKNKLKSFADSREKELKVLSIYEKHLHINNYTSAINVMNDLFDNMPTQLQNDFPKVNEKEILYITLFLLEIPIKDIYLILDYKTDSIKKMRYRLASKLNLKSAANLNNFISQYFKMPY